MKQLFLILCLLLAPLTATYAVRVASLYEAEVSLPSQTEDMRQQAVQEGFLQVLIKLSGDPTIATNPAVKPYLARADYYVKDMSYSPVTTYSSTYSVRIRYEADDVDRLLKKLNLNTVPIHRPLILVWLVVKNNHEADIISPVTGSKIYADIKSQCKKSGIPVIFPIMDVDDVTRVTIDDVSEMDIPVLEEAGRRYAPEGMLIGAIDEQGKSTKSKWRLILGDSEWRWQITDKTSAAVITTILDQVSQTMLKRIQAAPSEKKSTSTDSADNA